jgi:hypothetical protein
MITFSISVSEGVVGNPTARRRTIHHGKASGTILGLVHKPWVLVDVVRVWAM